MTKQFHFVLLLPAVLWLSSCTSYYHSTIDTTQRGLFLNDDRDFVQENDTISVIYSFYGENLPIGITIYNKLDRPLVLDWQHSALIVDDSAESYSSQTVDIRGQTRNSTYAYLDYLAIADSYGDFSGQATLPEGSAFIPPKSKINATPITLTNFTFEKIPKDSYTKSKLATMNSDNKNVRVLNFTEEDSPLRFRSYLTLYTLAPNGARDRSIISEQDFYLSRLIKAGSTPPSELLDGQKKSGDYFYVRKTKGAKAGLITGVIAASVAIGIIDAAIGE